MRPTILLVEPNAYVRHLLRHMIEDAGGDVEDAPDGATAIRYLSTNPRPDAIVVDPELPPPWNGTMVMNQVRFHPSWLSIPMIACSTKHERNDILRAKKLGAVGFVAKPNVRKEVLIPMLAKVLKRDRQLAEARAATGS